MPLNVCPLIEALVLSISSYWSVQTAAVPWWPKVVCSSGRRRGIRGGELFAPPRSSPRIIVSVVDRPARQLDATIDAPMNLICTVQRHDGNTARLARRSEETVGVRVRVARIAPSLLDLGRAAQTNSFQRGLERRSSYEGRISSPAMDCAILKRNMCEYGEATSQQSFEWRRELPFSRHTGYPEAYEGSGKKGGLGGGGSGPAHPEAPAVETLEMLSSVNIIIIMVVFCLMLSGMCCAFLYKCTSKLMHDHRIIRASHYRTCDTRPNYCSRSIRNTDDDVPREVRGRGRPCSGSHLVIKQPRVTLASSEQLDRLSQKGGGSALWGTYVLMYGVKVAAQRGDTEHASVQMLAYPFSDWLRETIWERASRMIGYRVLAKVFLLAGLPCLLANELTRAMIGVMKCRQSDGIWGCDSWYRPFTVTAHLSEALLKFYFQDIPSPHANKAELRLENCTKRQRTELRNVRGMSILDARSYLREECHFLFLEVFLESALGAGGRLVCASRGHSAELRGVMPLFLSSPSTTPSLPPLHNVPLGIGSYTPRGMANCWLALAHSPTHSAMSLVVGYGGRRRGENNTDKRRSFTNPDKKKNTPKEENQNIVVAERLARSPPTKANRVQSPAGSLDFSQVGIMPDDAIGRQFFSGISRFPPASSFRRRSIFTLQSSSSALKTSLLRASQISSLTQPKYWSLTPYC
ncbi:hypothetical protein PR048_030821 [Dryococelus australis]|uniref:Uncharacterized protein n=1 Tax=Dryococelus australis TaxID=614101 RepID=A0ABQ9GDU5_9NEOP|nr:hypothetical protein PR048_030821 [Dryococelus australis]